MSARQHRVVFAPSPHPLFVAEVSGDDPATPLFQDLLGILSWSQLSLLASCAARQVGFGHDLASITYGDDPDDGDEPFDGVRITADFRAQSAELSRAELDAILADLFELAIASSSKAGEPWWPELVDCARRIAARTERPLP